MREDWTGRSFLFHAGYFLKTRKTMKDISRCHGGSVEVFEENRRKIFQQPKASSARKMLRPLHPSMIQRWIELKWCCFYIVIHRQSTKEAHSKTYVFIHSRIHFTDLAVLILRVILRIMTFEWNACTVRVITVSRDATVRLDGHDLRLRKFHELNSRTDLLYWYQANEPWILLSLILI